MTAILVICLIFLPLIVVSAVASWRAKRLLSSGSISTCQYFINALVVGTLLPVVLLTWNTIDLVTKYAPDKCGSWWLGASEDECSLMYYVMSRTLATFIFLLGPYTIICLLISFGVFWTAKTRIVKR
jgi:hypothetical protein